MVCRADGCGLTKSLTDLVSMFTHTISFEFRLSSSFSSVFQIFSSRCPFYEICVEITLKLDIFMYVYIYVRGRMRFHGLHSVES